LFGYQIRWENRFRGNIGNECLVSVDGTDFEINEPTPFSTDYWSHKFNGPGLRYEIALNIMTGDIVWVNGPFPCGANPDLVIFRRDLMHKLEPWERVEADQGYIAECPQHVKTHIPLQAEQERDMRALALARHEHVNGRLKNFAALRDKFHHNAHREEKHGLIVHALAVAVQLSFELGESLHQIEYDDRPGRAWDY
jgi:hypothetical protein